jgi:hypothetical protein
VASVDGGSREFSVLWNSSKLVGETGGDARKKKLCLTAKTTITAEK